MWCNCKNILWQWKTGVWFVPLLSKKKNYITCYANSCYQIDHSVVESFGGGGRTCMTLRVYPQYVLTSQTSGLYAFNHGSQEVKMRELNAWEMTRARVNLKMMILLARIGFKLVSVIKDFLVLRFIQAWFVSATVLSRLMWNFVASQDTYFRKH